jgi:hypothetical protein
MAPAHPTQDKAQNKAPTQALVAKQTVAAAIEAAAKEVVHVEGHAGHAKPAQAHTSKGRLSEAAMKAVENLAEGKENVHRAHQLPAHAAHKPAKPAMEVYTESASKFVADAKAPLLKSPRVSGFS